MSFERMSSPVPPENTDNIDDLREKQDEQNVPSKFPEMEKESAVPLHAEQRVAHVEAIIALKTPEDKHDLQDAINEELEDDFESFEGFDATSGMLPVQKAASAVHVQDQMLGMVNAQVRASAMSEQEHVSTENNQELINQSVAGQQREAVIVEQLTEKGKIQPGMEQEEVKKLIYRVEAMSIRSDSEVGQSKKRNELVTYAVTGVNDNEVQESRERVERGLSRWSSDIDSTGTHGFTLQYDQAKAAELRGDDTRMKELKTQLRKSGMTIEETSRMIEWAEENQIDIQEYRAETEQNYALYLLKLKDAENGGNRADVLELEYEKVLEEYGEEAAREAFRTKFAEIAEGDEELTALVAVFKEEKRVEVALAQATAVAALRLKLSSGFKKDGIESTYDAFTPTEKAAIEVIVEEGGTDLLTAVFDKGIRKTVNGYAGTVSGLAVELNLSTKKIQIVGEHAGDPGKNKFPDPYPVDPPTLNTFDEVVFTMLAKENGVSSLAEPGFKEVLTAIGAKIAEDPERNNRLATEDGIHSVHNFFVVLFEGAEGPQEVQRIEELGIKNADTSVKNQRLENIKTAYEYYVPLTRKERMAHNQLPLQYAQLQTLVALWNALENDSARPDLNLLKALTTELASAQGATAKDAVLQEFILANGYTRTFTPLERESSV